MMRNSAKKTRVALASGGSREEAVSSVLALAREDLATKIRGRVLVKPNFLSSTHRLSSTMPGAVIPVLDLLNEMGIETVTIAEGGSRSTGQAIENFGYGSLPEKYDVSFHDINRGRFPRSFEVITTSGGSQRVEYTDLSEIADTVISVPVAKTHDAAMTTLSIKNMMGCLRRVHRPRMHGIQLGDGLSKAAEILWNSVEGHPLLFKSFSGAVFSTVKKFRAPGRKNTDGSWSGLERQCAAMSENLARMGVSLMPDIAVIDAFEAMEGNGPGSSGTAVDMGLALAGTDPVACDAVMAYLMGFDPMEDVGYLRILHDRGLGCADIAGIEIIGGDLAPLRRNFRPHENYEAQKRWREVRASLLPAR